jgi:Na+/H+-dicarboxylate symporter
LKQKTKGDQFMRSHLVWCLWLNTLATLLAVALLYFYPPLRGFTITTAKQTRFVEEGGPLLGAVLMICTSFLIAVYLAFRVYKTAVL